MSPIPIAFAVPAMNVGGTPRHLLEVLGRLDRRRFSPVLYCLRTRVRDAYLAEAGALGIEVVDARVAPTLWGPGLVSAIARLAGEFSRRGVRIVHSYLFHGNFLGTLAARVARVPVALVSKRSLDTYGRASERAACRLANRLADVATVNAEAVRLHVHRVERCPLEKIVVIPNGIDLSRVPVEPRPASTPEPVVGTIGRLAWKKGHTDLLRAVPRVLEQVPGARFLIVGGGPLRADLEQEAHALGIAGRVHFAGAVVDGARLLAGMDVFVLPSRMEGMSNSLLEAMAAGRPVVATDVGGNAEVVVDGETGLVVPPRDPVCLADAIVTLLADPERRQAMGRAAQARARAHFTVETMVGRLQALYADLLAARGVSVA